MKKILSSIAILAISFANAQDIKFGVKAGLNLSTVKATVSQITVNGMEASGEAQENSFKPGFYVGGFSEISFSDKFALQPELHFSYQGSKFTSVDSQTQVLGSYLFVTQSNSKTDLTTLYFNVPVLAKYNITEKIFVNAGPQVGLLVAANSKYESSGTSNIYLNGSLQNSRSSNDSGSENVKSSLGSIDFGVAVGGGFNFTDNLFAEVRYYHGLLDFGKTVSAYGTTSTSSMKSSAFQLGVGYKF